MTTKTGLLVEAMPISCCTQRMAEKENRHLQPNCFNYYYGTSKVLIVYGIKDYYGLSLRHTVVLMQGRTAIMTYPA